MPATVAEPDDFVIDGTAPLVVPTDCSTLERAATARTVGALSESLYQTLPALVQLLRALSFSACCVNITRLNLVSMPIRALPLPAAVQFDQLRGFDVYYGATAAALGLLARMPGPKRLGMP